MKAPSSVSLTGRKASAYVVSSPSIFAWSHALGIQEYVEAVSFLHYIRHRSLISLEEINARLVFMRTEKADVRVHSNSLLLSLLLLFTFCRSNESEWAVLSKPSDQNACSQMYFSRFIVSVIITSIPISLCSRCHPRVRQTSHLSEFRSWPSRWRPRTTCSAWPTWPESWCACASAVWATGTSTHPFRWASSCGRSTTVSPTSATRAHTRSPKSCTRYDRAWAKWRTPATPCASAARRSPNTCWLTCSPVGPRSWTPRKEWSNPSRLQSSSCSPWCL